MDDKKQRTNLCIISRINHHYRNIEVILMEDILWELFKKTGEIKYYRLYQAIAKKK